MNGRSLQSNRRGSRRSGQSLVEFGLCLPLLLILMMAVVEFGFSYYQILQLTDAAREGARYGAQRRSDAEVLARVQAIAPGFSLTSTHVKISAMDINGGPLPANDRTTGAQLRVKITCGARYLTALRGILPAPPPTLAASATFRVEQP